MKKTAWLAIVLLMIAGCSRQGSLVEKIMEHGVEVVVNGAEPYELPNVRSPRKYQASAFIKSRLLRSMSRGIYIS